MLYWGFHSPSAGGEEIQQITVSEEEIPQGIDLRNNEDRWRKVCQHSHSRPKYLSLQKRCEEQRGHRGRKTHKQGKQAVWKFVILKWPQYHASKNESVLLNKRKEQKTGKQGETRVRIGFSSLVSCPYSCVIYFCESTYFLVYLNMNAYPEKHVTMTLLICLSRNFNRC